MKALIFFCSSGFWTALIGTSWLWLNPLGASPAELPAKESPAQESRAQKSPADFLKLSLQNYQADFLRIPIRQEIFMSVIKTSLSSEGFLALSRDKFRLELEGNPALLSLFDGKTFWHQPDKREKIVFKFKQVQAFQKLSTFLNYQSLLENFEIEDFKNLPGSHIYKLRPKKNSPLSSIYIKTDRQYLVEIRLSWKDLNNWQRYHLSKPLSSKASSSQIAQIFRFSTTGFKVIERSEKIQI